MAKKKQRTPERINTDTEVHRWETGDVVSILREGSIDDIKPNDWNPNTMPESKRSALEKSIDRHGYTDLIKVRIAEDGSKEIVDGEQRWNDLRSRGITRILYVDLGPISREEAMKMTVVYNETRGLMDPYGTASIIDAVVDFYGGPNHISDIGLPWTDAEVQGILDTFNKEMDHVSRNFGGKDNSLDNPVTDVVFHLARPVLDEWYAVKNRVAPLVESATWYDTKEDYDAQVLLAVCRATQSLTDEELEHVLGLKESN